MISSRRPYASIASVKKDSADLHSFRFFLKIRMQMSIALRSQWLASVLTGASEMKNNACWGSNGQAYLV